MIILCVGNISEGCYWIESDNPIYGRTNNPHDLSRTAGGSSGGTAALITICGSPVGIGTDMAGSIRLPAFYNGIFGLKPTNKILTNNIYNKNNNFCQYGPFSKYSKDLEPLLMVMIKDKPEYIEKLNEIEFNLKNVRIIDITQTFNNKKNKIINDDIIQSIQKIKMFCQDQNIEIINKSYYELSLFIVILNKLLNEEEILINNNDFKNIFINYTFGKITFPTMGAVFSSYLKDYYLNLNNDETFDSIIKKIEEDLNKDLNDPNYITFLLVPPFSTTAPYHNNSLEYIHDISLLAIYNIIGLPAISLPTEINEFNIPLGIQLVSKEYNDLHLIKFSEFLENHNFVKWIQPYILKKNINL